MNAEATAASPPAFLPLVAHPHRWRLLSELARSDRRVGELSELLGEPQSLVSYHLAQLRDAGLIAARRSSADRRDSYYRVDLPRCRALFAASSAALHPGIGLQPSTPPLPARGHARQSKVLFLCTGNSARSQMAEALLQHRSAGTVSARSAGSHPKPLHPYTVRVMAERGIDIAGRPTRHLGRFARTHFDHVVTLCDKVREICPEFPGQPSTAHWSMPDPSAEIDGDEDSYAAFVRTADEIDARVELLIAQIAHESANGRTTDGKR